MTRYSKEGTFSMKRNYNCLQKHCGHRFESRCVYPLLCLLLLLAGHKKCSFHLRLSHGHPVCVVCYMVDCSVMTYLLNLRDRPEKTVSCQNLGLVTEKFTFYFMVWNLRVLLMLLDRADGCPPVTWQQKFPFKYFKRESLVLTS